VYGSAAHANVSLAQQSGSGVGRARRERTEVMESIDRYHERNVEGLEQYALRDRAIEPKGQYEALFFVEAPEAVEGQRRYAIRIGLADEVHELKVVQTVPKE
jgi:hypothetical protein